MDNKQFLRITFNKCRSISLPYAENGLSLSDIRKVFHSINPIVWKNIKEITPDMIDKQLGIKLLFWGMYSALSVAAVASENMSRSG